MKKEIKLLLIVLCVLLGIAVIFFAMYFTGTLEFSVNPLDKSKAEYSEKESAEDVQMSWELNDEYIINHLPEDINKNTLLRTDTYESAGNSYDTCFVYCNDNGAETIDNIMEVNDAYSIGEYSKVGKSYYVVVYNSNFEEDKTFTILQYERIIK